MSANGKKSSGKREIKTMHCSHILLFLSGEISFFLPYPFPHRTMIVEKTTHSLLSKLASACVANSFQDNLPFQYQNLWISPVFKCIYKEKVNATCLLQNSAPFCRENLAPIRPHICPVAHCFTRSKFF